MNNTIPRNIARGLLVLLNNCYKRGVRAAAVSGCQALTDEFALTHRIPGRYGEFDGVDMDWRQWLLKMTSWSRSQSYNNGPRRWMLQIRNCNTINGCVLPIGMEFYIQGVKDYFKNPTQEALTIVEQRGNVRYTDKGVRSIGSRATLAWMQEVLFNVKKIHSEYFGMRDKNAIKPSLFDKFSNQIWYAYIDEDVWYDTNGKA